MGPLSVRLPRNSVLEISKHLAIFAAHSPVEFAHKARSVDDVLKWKATEFSTADAVQWTIHFAGSVV